MSILKTSLSRIMMIRLQYHLELAAPLSKPHHTQISSLSDEERIKRIKTSYQIRVSCYLYLILHGC